LLLLALMSGAACRSERPTARSDETGLRPSEQSTPTEPIVVGNATEPLATFDRFLDRALRGQLATDEGRALIGAEIDPEEFEGSELARCNKIVRIDADHAVARVSAVIPPRKFLVGDLGEGMPETTFPAWAVDYYWFLEKTDRWRVAAIRGLAATELLQMIAWAFPDASTGGEWTTRSARNAQLTLKSDRELAEWYRVHRVEIATLASRARELSVSGERTVFEGSPEESENEFSRAAEETKRELAGAPAALGPLHEEIDALYILLVEVDAQGVVDVTVGGQADNAVIFRQVPGGAMPHIAQDEIIWAEDLGGGWFLVRTT